MKTPALPSFLDPQKSLACVHCGLCLGSCPTYLETGNENESPRGRIHLMRALQSSEVELDAATVGPIDRCLGCRACESACPSGVEYGRLLESTRAHIETRFRRSVPQTLLRRLFIERVVPRPALFRWAVRPAQWLKAAFPAAPFPDRIRGLLDLAPDASSSPSLARRWAPRGVRKGRVGFLEGCVMSVSFGRTNEASAQLLADAGFEVVVPKGQQCCGALYSHGGNEREARRQARVNLAAFESLELDAVIANAAGCGSALKEYGHLFENDPDWADRARRFSSQVRDLTEWLDEHLDGAEPAAQPSGERVVYHDACHLAHAQQISSAPRRLLQRAGARLVPLPEADVCCGSAGSYNLTEPAMAERLQARKTRNILASGAQAVVTSNPGCILQIRAGLKRAGAPHVRVLHIADYLLELRSGRSIVPARDGS